MANIFGFTPESGLIANYVTLHSAQTIPADKTFSGNVRFNASIQQSYGGHISATYSFPELGPLASFYTITSNAFVQINVPPPTPELAGTRVLFKKTDGISNQIVTFRVVNDPSRACWIGFNTLTLGSSVSISTQFQCELIYLEDRIIQTNVT